MVLFTILAIIAAIIAIISILTVAVGGVGFILVFGDLIVCVVLIILLMRWLFKRKK